MSNPNAEIYHIADMNAPDGPKKAEEWLNSQVEKNFRIKAVVGLRGDRVLFIMRTHDRSTDPLIQIGDSTMYPRP